MPMSSAAARIAATTAAALALSVGLAACTASSGFVQTRAMGYVMPDDAIKQVRPGQSQQLVQVVMGSPMTSNTFGTEEAWYYVETKVNQTAFGLNIPVERKVLAVYFGKDKKVVDTALYGLKDGRAIPIESRRTPSFGEDRNFIESILASL